MLSNFLLTSALLTQKYSRDGKALLDKIELIFGSVNRGRKENLIQAIVVYFMQLTEKQNVTLSDIVKPLPSPVKNIFMSIYDSILAEGIEKGIERGIEKGVEKGLEKGAEKKAIIMIANTLDMLEMSNSQIAHLAGVEVTLVKIVRDKMASGEWKTHPAEWDNEEWEAYFDKK